MILTGSDVALLHSRPHRTNLYMSIYQPKTVMSCRITGSVTWDERTIPYYNRTSTGTYLNVEADMTMLVGSSAGASDIGRIRTRSAGSGSFVVAENSDIHWQNGQYITILDYVDANPIFHHLVISSGSEPDVSFYMDYDIPYTNQNTVYGTLPNMGPHRALFLDGGSGTVYYTSSGTYNVNGSSLLYFWNFEGGNPATYNGAVPGLVTYTAPGHYRTRLIISGSAGESDVAYRYISVYNRPGEGSFIPILEFELTSLEGSRSGNGYTANITVHQVLQSLPDEALVIVFADDWYGGTKKSLGGNSPNNAQVVFVGYVSKGTISYDYQKSRTEFTVESITNTMKLLESFALNYESVNSPTKWFEAKDLTISKAIYAYLRWHSTVLKIADVVYAMADIPIQYFDADNQSVFDALHSFVNGSRGADVVSDRQGRVWIEQGAETKHSALTSVPVSMDISKRDWLNEPKIEERVGAAVSWLELGGIAWSGSVTGTMSPLLSDAPGITHGYRGTSDYIAGFAVVGQTELNQLSGDIYAQRNAQYPNMTLILAGNYRNLDIAPLEACNMNVAADDTIRGITMVNKPFYLMSLQWIFNAEEELLYVGSADFTEVTEGFEGDTVAVPVEPPDDNPPPPDIPPLPPIILPSLFSTKTYTWTISYPAMGGIPGPKLGCLHMLADISAYVVGAGTGSSASAIFNIEDRSTIGVAGANLMSGDLTAGVGGASASGTFAQASVLADHWLWLDIAAVGGAPSFFVVTLRTVSIG